MSLAAHIILLTFAGYIIYNANPGSSLFSWHPTFMILSFVLQTEGVLLFKYFKPANRVPIHWAFQASSLTCQFLGFFAIYNHKENNKTPHFTTYHGLFGLFTFGFTIMQSVGGNVAKFSHLLGGMVNPTKVKRGHRFFGLVVLALLYSTVHLALYSSWVGAFLKTFGSLWLLAAVSLGIPLAYTLKGITVK